jgi:hypothetical protein
MTDAISRPYEIIFDRLQSDGLATLQELVAVRQEENLYIDFKLKENPGRTGLTDDDKRNLGKALSGFSNSDGGVLIWGIDASKGADNIDCAQGLSPISNLAQFERNIKSLIPTSLMPANTDIEVFSVLKAAGTDVGFLVLKVGRSHRRPHRSEIKGDKRYYRRVGDNFFLLEHYELEDMFRLRGLAELEASYYVSIRSTSPGTEVGIIVSSVHIKFGLLNRSRQPAKFPYMYVWGSNLNVQALTIPFMREESGTATILLEELRMLFIRGKNFHSLASRMRKYVGVRRAGCHSGLSCTGAATSVVQVPSWNIM